MEYDAIYKAMLAVLCSEATEAEQLLLEKWLNLSKENWIEFEVVAELYRRVKTFEQVDTSFYDVERAWQNVMEKRKGKKNFPPLGG